MLSRNCKNIWTRWKKSQDKHLEASTCYNKNTFDSCSLSCRCREVLSVHYLVYSELRTPFKKSRKDLNRLLLWINSKTVRLHLLTLNAQGSFGYNSAGQLFNIICFKWHISWGLYLLWRVRSCTPALSLSCKTNLI